MTNSSLIESATICYKVYKLYKELLNSYVSDFYLENHWKEKLPNSWRIFLEKTNIPEIAQLLDLSKKFDDVCPLALTCLRQILQRHSISREQVGMLEEMWFSEDANFMNFFWKNVKIKKRHEVGILSKICHKTALKTNCFNIVDIGSGLGHLGRMLSFGYGFNVCTFEANPELSQRAEKLDLQFQKILALKSISHKNHRKTKHISKRIEETTTKDEFELLVKQAFGNFDKGFKFGIVGLHPCGNLGSTLLRLYNESDNVDFINIVSCCYMKITLVGAEPKGFPLSKLYISQRAELDYLSCETACHAIENYVEKIKTKDRCHLKIHSFRAALECLLVKKDEKIRHSAVANVKFEENMTFSDYCKKALRKSDFTLCDSDISDYEKIVNKTWEDVVAFYSIRLLLASLVESMILYDRLLYVKESTGDCDILPAFDCRISPRNHVLSATKTIIR